MDIRERIRLLPNAPGVYRFLDETGQVIYVGKAKSLRNRVAQYFVPRERLTRKTALMVSRIADLQHTVVDSEADALLLENNLIKQYKPKYNILLKDSKTYPWICVTNEDFPRVLLTRKFVKSAGTYFGPYSSAGYARSLIELFENLYPLRDCRRKFTAEDAAKKPLRPCLNFHTGKCKAPCAGGISKEEYGENISEIIRLLKGGGREMIRLHTRRMQDAASRLAFEEAEIYRRKAELLRKHYGKSLIVSADIADLDVFSMIFDGSTGYGNYFRVRQGCIIQSMNLAMKMNIEEDEAEMLEMFIAEIASSFGELSKEILVSQPVGMELPGIEIHVPQRGEKAGLLELSRKNAAAFRFDQLKQDEHSNPEEYHEKVMEQLRSALGMEKLPRHIECFDNSNIQGTNPVASCVVFRDGKPSKADYRHFNIKTVVGANDFASMKEVLNRRYSRLIREGAELPDLIVIDGGKGQLSFACEALAELGILEKVKVVGLAKRLEEIIVPGDPYPLFLDKNSSALKLMMQIRDEAHRFGITHHRNRRSKSQIESRLRDIPGVGEKTEEALLRHFGSAQRVSKATYEDLAATVGKSVAQKILKFYGRGLLAVLFAVFLFSRTVPASVLPWLL